MPRETKMHKSSLFVFQPGKLTEAFKYFLQGMGYSKYAVKNAAVVKVSLQYSNFLLKLVLLY